jgi:hypothetical protein
MGRREKAIWTELAQMAPARVLANSDRWLVEIACVLMARMRAHGIGGRDGLQIAEVAQLNSCLSKMGLTPVDRSRVNVPPHEDEQNPFAQIAAEAGVSKSIQ